MDLSLTTETFGQDDQSWLGSQHGTDAARTITLDVSKFTEGTHYPDGYLTSGIVLGKVTATGEYGPYDGTAGDGRETAAGFLFQAVKTPAVNTTPVVAAILEHGKVIQSTLPFQAGAGSLDAAGITDLGSHFKVL
jgi:hypothetical protein